MRCRRLCEKKPSGKLQVEQDIVDRYKAGGTDREELEMALLESISKWGLDRSNYKKIKAQHSSVYIYIANPQWVNHGMCFQSIHGPSVSG